MGATYTRQSSYTDGDVIQAADTNNEFDQLLAAFAASTGHTHDGTAAEGGPVTKLLGTSLTLGDGTAGTDITVTFDGESNDGVIKWMEDEDYFEFSDDILVASTEKLQFRDTAIYINSSADGQLDLVADTEIQIAATTIDINGNADISGNLGIGGNLTVTGTTTFNGGTLTLGDADTDNIVFGGEVDSNIIPDDDNTYDLGSASKEWKDIYIDGVAYLDAIDFNGTAITATAAELNIMDGVTSTAAELNKLDGATVTVSEINILDGDTTASSTTVADADRVVFNDDGTMKQVAVTDLAAYFDDEITAMPNLVSTGALASGSIANGFGTITTTGVITGGTLEATTDTAAGDNAAMGYTAAEGLILTGQGSTNDVTIKNDADADVIEIPTGTTNVTVAGTLGVSGGSTNGVEVSQGAIAIKNGGAKSYVDFYCESSNAHYTRLEAAAHSAYSGNVTATLPTTTGTLALTSEIPTTEETQDLVGAMFSSNTETNITVTYQDSDGTIDLVVDAAQPNVTSLGTLTSLAVDDVVINGTTIGHTDDTDLLTLASNVLTVAGEVDATSLDISGDADIDGTLEADAITVNGTALNTVIAGVTVANATLAATATVTDSTANTNFPVVFHDESNALLDDTGALRYNPSTGELLVPKLTVAGTTTTVDTVTMNAENAIIFEGATADAHETTLTIVDPTADRTINLPNQSGTIPVLAAASNTAVTSTPDELNILDGATVVVGEINALDLGSTAVGNAIASKAMVLDANKDYTGIRNFTLTGELDAGSLDISGDADIDGTLEADAITVNGTALATVIAGTTVTNATNSAHVLVTDNENTNEENLIAFVEGATSSTGNVGLEMDGDFAYNPSTGTVTATIFKGNIDAVDGDFDGTLEADAITVGGATLNSVIADEATALAIALG